MQGDTNSVADLGDEILLHAKVHAFAHEYICSDLLKYSLVELRVCFAKTNRISSKTLPKVFDAFGYVYSNTPSSEIELSPARKEITQFVIANHTKLAIGRGIDGLDDAGCVFLSDIASGLSQTLAQKEKYLGMDAYKSDITQGSS